jgi:putative phage-type endonuclease
MTMKRITHDCQQGTQSWLDLRAKYFTASELAAAAGESKYQTRSALLKAKATGIAEEVDDAKQRLFDAGHASEAAARPIVERMVDAELYPVTMSVEIDGLPLLASLDGIDILGDVIWENKLRSDSLVEQVNSGRLDPHYTYQIEQQLLVSGAGKCYFTTSDGTPEGTFGLWYESNPEIRAKIVSIWKQFAKDLAEYQHVEAKPAVVADTIEDLPALTVQLVGQVTASNLDTFKNAVTVRIQAINTALVTDADFANADKMVKFLDDGEKRLDLVKAQALAQTESIDTLFRTIDALKAEMRSKRLTLDKLVKAEKENRKNEIVHAARSVLIGHVQNLHARIEVSCIQIDSGIFAEAIKGLKSLDSMRDKVSVALANAKIEANAVADRIDANRKEMGEHSALFPDFAQVCTKAPDDFAALVAMRVAAKKEADEKLLADQREKIRREVEEDAARVAATQAEQVKQMAPRVMGAIDTAEQSGSVSVEMADALRESVAAIVVDSAIDSAKTSGKTIKLGEICARLGFTVTADFLSTLGFDAVAHNKNAKLYYESSFKGICAGISAHVLNVGSKPMKEAA